MHINKDVAAHCYSHTHLFLPLSYYHLVADSFNAQIAWVHAMLDNLCEWSMYVLTLLMILLAFHWWPNKCRCCCWRVAVTRKRTWGCHFEATSTPKRQPIVQSGLGLQPCNDRATLCCMLAPVWAPHTCSVRTLVFTLDNGNLNSHELRVFCAAAMNAARSFVEFPQVADIHVNGTSGNLSKQ